MFTTVTVNNSYPTGTHLDAGDLADGFSTLAVIRRGSYTGGRLVFPAWQIGVDLRNGDLILMDAHQWHSNTGMQCEHGKKNDIMIGCCGAERISVVAYCRARMHTYGSAEEERERAVDQAEKRTRRKR
ncbi:hypothetical protein ABZ631_25240 [Nocardiopsis alba]|uniref:hypothetical protein n=1 Tax=Nocardiopsis alba TaxID=53437 RepID=UPI0033E765ED